MPLLQSRLSRATDATRRRARLIRSDDTGGSPEMTMALVGGFSLIVALVLTFTLHDWIRSILPF